MAKGSLKCLRMHQRRERKNAKKREEIFKFLTIRSFILDL